MSGVVPRQGHRRDRLGHDGRAPRELSGLRDGHTPGHPLPRPRAGRQHQPRAPGPGVRRGGASRVPLHGDTHPARRVDGRSGASDRHLLSTVRATLAGLCATLVGIGLARFAYTPLLPALVGAGWFAPPAAAYLGAANLVGYLVGALLGQRLAARVDAGLALRAMMALATAAFFACASPLSFAWYLLWRLAAGVAGGVLMVLAAPTVLPHVRPERRGVAGGVIFTGVGLGIAASGTVVPLLLRWGARSDVVWSRRHLDGPHARRVEWLA